MANLSADDRGFAAKCIRVEQVMAAQRRLDRAAKKLREAYEALDVAEKEFSEALKAAAGEV